MHSRISHLLTLLSRRKHRNNDGAENEAADRDLGLLEEQGGYGAYPLPVGTYV